MAFDAPEGRVRPAPTGSSILRARATATLRLCGPIPVEFQLLIDLPKKESRLGRNLRRCCGPPSATRAAGHRSRTQSAGQTDAAGARKRRQNANRLVDARTLPRGRASVDAPKPPKRSAAATLTRSRRHLRRFRCSDTRSEDTRRGKACPLREPRRSRGRANRRCRSAKTSNETGESSGSPSF